MRAQPEAGEYHEAGRLGGQLESENVSIKRQQVVQVFAPDGCSAQPCDHRGGSFLAPISALRSNSTAFDAWNEPMGPCEDHPMSVAYQASVGPREALTITRRVSIRALLLLEAASRLALHPRWLVVPWGPN